MTPKDILYQRGLITRSNDPTKDWRVNASVETVEAAIKEGQTSIITMLENLTRKWMKDYNSDYNKGPGLETAIDDLEALIEDIKTEV